MSTRVTIACGDGYHLYNECLTEDVYLELDGDKLEYEASNNHVNVHIPKEVINAIIAKGPFTVRYSDKPTGGTAEDRVLRREKVGLSVDEINPVRENKLLAVELDARIGKLEDKFEHHFDFRQRLD